MGGRKKITMLERRKSEKDKSGVVKMGGGNRGSGGSQRIKNQSHANQKEHWFHPNPTETGRERGGVKA